ncbi:hypothetical protein HOY82DRAFT_571808, partial [Tuber indicum]
MNRWLAGLMAWMGVMSNFRPGMPWARVIHFQSLFLFLRSRFFFFLAGWSVSQSVGCLIVEGECGDGEENEAIML